MNGSCEACGMSDGAFYDVRGRSVCADCMEKALESLKNPPNTQAAEVVRLLDELLSEFGGRLRHETLHRIVRLGMGK